MSRGGGKLPKTTYAGESRSPGSGSKCAMAGRLSRRFCQTPLLLRGNVRMSGKRAYVIRGFAHAATQMSDTAGTHGRLHDGRRALLLLSAGPWVCRGLDAASGLRTPDAGERRPDRQFGGLPAPDLCDVPTWICSKPASSLLSEATIIEIESDPDPDPLESSGIEHF